MASEIAQSDFCTTPSSGDFLEMMAAANTGITGSNAPIVTPTARTGEGEGKTGGDRQKGNESGRGGVSSI